MLSCLVQPQHFACNYLHVLGVLHVAGGVAVIEGVTEGVARRG